VRLGHWSRDDCPWSGDARCPEHHTSDQRECPSKLRCLHFGQRTAPSGPRLLGIASSGYCGVSKACRAICCALHSATWRCRRRSSHVSTSSSIAESPTGNSRIPFRAAMRSRAPLSPSSILTAANRPRPISAGLPRRPPRTGTTASGSTGVASNASMSRSIRLGAIAACRQAE
jgi:hypothetical protein